MNVQKDKVQTGEARLRKYVVTDTETVEVPVTREEVRVERTPISADEAANYKGSIDEGGQEARGHGLEQGPGCGIIPHGGCPRLWIRVGKRSGRAYMKIGSNQRLDIG